MKTSPVRHPKFEHAVTIHRWMMKACHGNIFAALLLGYLESKYHVMLQVENKYKSWMRLQKFQIKNGCFADDWDDLELAIDILKGLHFINLDEVGSSEMPLDQGEIWIKFNARKINEWLEIYQKPLEAKLDMFDFHPFIYLLFLTKATYIEVEVPVERIVTVEKAVRTVKLDETYIGTARNLFDFWKHLTKHKRSNLQDKYAKMCIDRIKEGYTVLQIAHGIIGLTYSDHHMQNNYDHFQYVVRDVKQLDRMISIAIKNHITEDTAKTAYEQFLKILESGEIVPDMPEKKGYNPSTGSELK